MKKLRQIDPQFYDQLLKIFPDTVVHERYEADMDRQKIVAEYGKSWETIKDYIEKNFKDETTKNIALHRLYQIWKLSKAERNARLNCYPLDYVLKYFIRGEVRKLLLPYRKSRKEWKTLL